MELDSLFPEINPGEYIQFQRTTYVKIWEWLCGEKRVEDEKKRGKMKDRILYRTRLPKSCKGTLIRLGHWDVRERELISTLHVCSIYTSIIIDLFLPFPLQIALHSEGNLVSSQYYNVGLSSKS